MWRHNRALRLREPQLFTEWVQHRKLFDRDVRLPVLLDKVAVKALVAAKLGGEWIIPTLWHGNDLPHQTPWPTPLVVKPRGGCNQIAFVREIEDWPMARRMARRWAGASYGRWLDEWAYGKVPRGLIVEPYIGSSHILPIDYKCFVFGGRVEFVQVHLDRASAHRWVVMDRRWRRVSPDTSDPDPIAPATLDRIIIAAETLAANYDFLRADFYEVDGVPLFGELTVYPGSGLLPVVPPSLDRQMGEFWRAARSAP